MDELSTLMNNMFDLFSEREYVPIKPEKYLNSFDLDGVASFINSDKCKLASNFYFD